jgi:hypothetical protein
MLVKLVRLGRWGPVFPPGSYGATQLMARLKGDVPPPELDALFGYLKDSTDRAEQMVVQVTTRQPDNETAWSRVRNCARRCWSSGGGSGGSGGGSSSSSSPRLCCPPAARVVVAERAAAVVPRMHASRQPR